MKPFFGFDAAAPHLRPDDLSRLAAHDLPSHRAKIVHRHLAICPSCQAEWRAVQTVWRAAEWENARLSALPPSDTLGARIFAALPDHAAPERKWNMSVVFARPLAAAVTIATLTAGGLVYGPALFFRAPRAIAFADVEAAMAGVQTATWAETESIPNHKTNLYDVTEGANVWVRLDPPAQLRKSTGYEGKPEGTRFLETERGTLSYTPGKNDYFLFDSGDGNAPSAGKLRNRIIQSLLFPRTEPGRSAQQNDWGSDDAPFKWKSTPWKSETVTLHGKPALVFSHHSIRFRDDSPFWKKQEKQQYDLQIYADPQTYRIVRREWQQVTGVGGQRRIVSDHFRYNETPQPGTFEAPPPPVGKPIVVSDWTKTGMYAKLPETDKKQIADLVYRSTTARQKNDWAAFSALRDFSYMPLVYTQSREEARETDKEKQAAERNPLRSETAYRAEIEKNFRSGKPYSVWRIDAIKRVGYGLDYVYVRKNATDPFPPTTPPTAIEVLADVTVKTPFGKAEPRWATFTVVRTDAGLRVAGISFRIPRPERRPSGLSPREEGMRAVFGSETKKK